MGDIRGTLGGLEEGRLADLALDVASLLVLFPRGSVFEQRTLRREEHGRLTTLSWDLAVLPSF